MSSTCYDDVELQGSLGIKQQISRFEIQMRNAGCNNHGLIAPPPYRPRNVPAVISHSLATARQLPSTPENANSETGASYTELITDRQDNTFGRSASDSSTPAGSNSTFCYKDCCMKPECGCCTGGWCPTDKCCEGGRWCWGCCHNSMSCCWKVSVIVIGVLVFLTMAALLSVYVIAEYTGCKDKYVVTLDSNTAPGIDAGWLSVHDCKRQCELSIIQCFGIDHNDELNRCWLHLNDYTIHQPGKTPGITNYKRKFNCHKGESSYCFEKYEISSDRQAEDDVGWAGWLSFEACKMRCEENYLHPKTCYGFDHTTTSGKGRCWLIIRHGYILSNAPQLGVSNYRRMFNCQRITTPYYGLTNRK